MYSAFLVAPHREERSMPRYAIASFAARTLCGIAIAATLSAAAFAHVNDSRTARPAAAMNGPMHEPIAAGKGPMTGAAEPGGSPWSRRFRHR